MGSQSSSSSKVPTKIEFHCASNLWNLSWESLESELEFLKKKGFVWMGSPPYQVMSPQRRDMDHPGLELHEQLGTSTSH